ncbi:MAG TPA: hypothetical protein VN851_12150, partial [Thermoanaerobaculia bacterium]|nr:hypothetical protein [Thermoanaerobaculia bacterium]
LPAIRTTASSASAPPASPAFRPARPTTASSPICLAAACPASWARRRRIELHDLRNVLQEFENELDPVNFELFLQGNVLGRSENVPGRLQIELFLFENVLEQLENELFRFEIDLQGLEIELGATTSGRLN